MIHWFMFDVSTVSKLEDSGMNIFCTAYSIYAATLVESPHPFSSSNFPLPRIYIFQPLLLITHIMFLRCMRVNTVNELSMFGFLDQDFGPRILYSCINVSGFVSGSNSGPSGPFGFLRNTEFYSICSESFPQKVCGGARIYVHLGARSRTRSQRFLETLASSLITCTMK